MESFKGPGTPPRLRGRCDGLAEEEEALFLLQLAAWTHGWLGGRVSGAAGSSARRRLHRRLGSTRAEAAQLHTAAPDQEEEEHDAGRTVRSKSRTDVGVGEVKAAAAKLSGMTQQEPDGLMSGSPSLCWSDSVPLPPCGRWVGRDPAPMNEVKVSPASAVRCSAKETFSSSFSFIQQSLNSSQTAETPPSQDPEPLIHKKGPNSPKSKGPVQLLPSASSGDPTDSEDLPSCRRFWLRCPWDRRGDPPDPPDCDAVDIEIISSFSVDSDNASASSVTSGYESATPTSDQGWDNLVKKYEGVLQDCLQNNRTYTKIESMMLKLQRLQQKAILDDDYDAAERFGKKLEELRGERGGLSLGLPSTQPSVALFLQRLRHAVHSVLQRPDWGHCRDVLDVAEQRDASPGPLQRRDKLVRERRLVEEDIAQLQRRLAELTERSRCLQQQIQQEEHQAEAEELESCVRRSCTTAQLRGLSQSLQDLVSCESRRQISVSPPVAMLRCARSKRALQMFLDDHLSPDHPSPDHPAQIIPAQIIPAQIISAQIIPAQIIPAQIISAQIISAQIIPAQILCWSPLPRLLGGVTLCHWGLLSLAASSILQEQEQALNLSIKEATAKVSQQHFRGSRKLQLQKREKKQQNDRARVGLLLHRLLLLSWLDAPPAIRGSRLAPPLPNSYISINSTSTCQTSQYRFQWESEMGE
ncbi:Disrupted in schizophrenia 1 protein [Takifugu flavidus]|uniref:Disrupted in schizophrenia 1 protein n=1 Tax=Takifugu flavidus TaxID=433684 RepID=A0A5C6PJZ3_9TELE|nr:Disrupted in schizophrenia 1 protein [Takifugu flavidus]